ncbi:MAG: restriction endonuclease subunit S [Methylomonas sp.]|nr:restriction endonuclease subunit S [Methylomonas sp.]
MKLPWIEVGMQDVCLLNPRLQIDERPKDDIEVTFVPMSAVDENAGVIAQPEIRNYSEVAKGYTSFREGDVLFAKVTPCMENGKATVVGPLQNGLGFGSTEFHVLRPTDEVLPEYLFHFIRQPAFRSRAASAFVGTGGLQRVPLDFLTRVKLPLPTLSEQQRIVDVLRQAETLTKLRQQFEGLLANTKRQLFVEMFGDPNPRGNTNWPVVKLGSVVTVATGGTPPREQADSFGGSIAWVKSTDLTDTPIDKTDESITELGVQRSNAKVYPKDTILLAMYGQGQTRGRTGKLLIEAACNQACAALLPSDEVLPDYLWVWLQLSYDAVRSLGRGGQQENLNLDIIRNIKLSKPPVDLQRTFSERLGQLLEIVKNTEAAKQQSEALISALRVDALTGSATEQWREKHALEIQEEVKQREELLRNMTSKPHKVDEQDHRSQSAAPKSVRAKTRDAAPDQLRKPNEHGRLARHWLLNELSEFQGAVWTMLRHEWPQKLVIVDDPEAFNDFCTNPQTTWPIEHFNASPNRIRRTLEQLAALGLIAKVSVPRQNAATQQTEYLTAFRPLRDDENSRLRDAAMLKNALNGNGSLSGYS